MTPSRWRPRPRCGRLVLIHHAPGRTDRDMAEIEAALTDAPVPTSIGREDDWVEARKPGILSIG